MASQLYVRSRHNSDDALEIQHLILCYPEITPRDLRRLILLFPRLSLMDYALMTADDRLSEPLASFHRDHGDKFYLPTRVLLAFLASASVAAVFFWWLLL